MRKIRVLVVEDSITIRKRLVEVLETDPGFEIVGEAADGRQAIDRCLSLRPDAVTMDMMLPVMSGLAATEYIMAHCPTPILVVSASFNRGELYQTYDALAAGAVEVIEKPTGHEPPGAWEQQFKTTLRIVSRVRVITHPRARLHGVSPPREPRAAAAGAAPPVSPLAPSATSPSGSSPSVKSSTASAWSAAAASGRPPCSLLAVGASTGGPSALVDVLGGLPREVGAPVLVVLHIGSAFASAFGDWLGTQLRRSVSFAIGGEPLNSLGNRVILAPPDRHLVLRGGRLALNDEPERHSCRPSIDVLFESLAAEVGAEVGACLLTGMGRDGALGLLALRQAGGATIAQDESTSVVYGMPREAALLGAAERILPLREIGGALAALARPARTYPP